MLIGVTGGMGSGKSTFSGLFADWGARLVDADRVTHQVLQNKGVVVRLQEAFGRDIVGEDGELRRQEIGRRAFAGPSSWKLLEEIVKPSLAPRLWQEVEDAWGGAEEGMVVVDGPLIYEWGEEERFDVMIAVDAEVDLRISRIRDRSGMSAMEIRQRMGFQMPAAEKRRKANFVVENGEGMGQLQNQAGKIWEILQHRQSAKKVEGR
jgi:dephospho-CoA kinase